MSLLNIIVPKWKRGKKSNIDETPIKDGNVLITTDTEEMYVDIDGKRLHIAKDNIKALTQEEFDVLEDYNDSTIYFITDNTNICYGNYCLDYATLQETIEENYNSLNESINNMNNDINDANYANVDYVYNAVSDRLQILTQAQYNLKKNHTPSQIYSDTVYFCTDSENIYYGNYQLDYATLLAKVNKNESDIADANETINYGLDDLDIKINNNYNDLDTKIGLVNDRIVYCTQAEYDALPSTKLTDDRVYFIDDDE